MNNIDITIVAHLIINSFCAGAYFKNQDLELNWSSLLGIVIYLIFGVEILIGVALWSIGERFFSWIARVTQIVFWFRYYTGYYNQMEARTLRMINQRLEYYKLQKKLELGERHFLKCGEFLNKKYGFDYAKYQEGNKLDGYNFTIFDEDNKFFYIKK